MPDLFQDKPKASRSSSDPTPPDVVETLGEFLERYQARGLRWPAGIPDGAFHAARYWVEINEDPHRYRDNPGPIYKGGALVAWSTPYHDRLLFSLQKFLGFNSAQQIWILEQIKRGIPWRGEEGKVYAAIIEQAEIMARDPAGYIGNATPALAAIRGARRGA
ncbi:MAG: hypothetical protein KJN67_05080 [Pontiella sp.]|nr:hypothetical protein [Pontiella sp.]